MRKRYCSVVQTAINPTGGTQLVVAEETRCLKEGHLVISNYSGVVTTIKQVISNYAFIVNSSSGFTSGTSIIIISDVFDGEVLSKYFPEFLRNDDFILFLHPFAQCIQELYTYSKEIPFVIDVETSPGSLLKYIASSIGTSVKPTDPEEIQREVIRLIMYMYRHKGSKLGIQAAFKAKGYKAEVKELYCKKFANQIDTVAGLTVTLKTVGAQLPTSGAFQPKDILALSTGSGSLNPVKFDGVYGRFKEVLDPYTYTIRDQDVGKFNNNDYLVIYDYSYDRGVEFPTASSYINVLFSDRLYPPRPFTEEILQELVNYTKEFLSTHARLWDDNGIERVLEIILDFREDGETDPEGVLIEVTDNSVEMEIDVLWDGVYKTALDASMYLDSGMNLDNTRWLSMSVEVIFEVIESTVSESIDFKDEYTIDIST